MVKKRIGVEHRHNRQLAIISKLIRNQTVPVTYDQNGNRKSIVPNQSMLQQISDRTAGVVSDIDSMRQTLPDIELSSQILVSSILSPKDLSVPRLAFIYSGSKLDDGLSNRLLKVIDDYFTNDYKINKNLAHELTEALVNKGAYIRMVVPESTLDDLINGEERLSLLSVSGHFLPRSTFLPNIGLVAKEGESLTLENVFSDSVQTDQKSGPLRLANNLFLSDNPDVIKLPTLFDKVSKQKTKDVLSSKYMTLEAVAAKVKTKREKKIKRELPHIGSSDIEIESKVYGGRNIKPEEVMEIHTRDISNKTNYGHPLVQTLPVESVIPAYIPGNPKEHIAYYIILDQYGNPINTSLAADHYRELQDAFNRSSSDNAVSQVIKELKTSFSGDYSNNNTVENLQQAQEVFGDLLERTLLEKVRLGTGKMTAAIAKPSALYQTMLARLAAKKQTQILYVPASLMSYIAFYHTVNGVGKSILENTRILGGLRVLMMFTNTMAAVRNSTARTELEIAFDPKDQDPLGTASLVKSGFMRTRSEGFPLGEGDPVSAITYLQNASVDVVYTGHPDLPEMKISTTDKAPSRTTVDSELEDSLRERHNMAFGLSPDTVDSSKDINFATSIVNSSLLLSKRVLIYQEQYEEAEGDFIRKYTLNSEILITSLLEVVEKAKNSEKKGMDDVKIVEHFIRNLNVELPKPDSVTIEAQMESFDKYKQSLESAVDSWISEDIAFMDGEGEMANYIRDLRASYIAKKLREYMKDNNMFTELEELTAKGPDGKPTLKLGEALSEHMTPLMASVEDWLHLAKDAAAKREAKLAKLEEKLEDKYNLEEEEDDSTGSDGDGNLGSEEQTDPSAAEEDGDMQGAAEEEEEQAEKPEEDAAAEEEGDKTTEEEPTEENPEDDPEEEQAPNKNSDDVQE